MAVAEEVVRSKNVAGHCSIYEAWDIPDAEAHNGRRSLCIHCLSPHYAAAVVVSFGCSQV